MPRPFKIAGILILLLGCVSVPKRTEDPYLWLEEIESPRALAWARGQNAQSMAELTGDPRYAPVKKKIHDILVSKDKIPYVTHLNGQLYNFWQDEKRIRGVWRRTTLQEYRKRNPSWETLIDLDELAARERENWVWKDPECLPPRFDRCLIALSRGGRDAVVIREFDTRSRKFVEGGFVLPEAKSTYHWLDQDHLFVATDFGPGTLTLSGYPRQVRKWTRGTPLSSAELIMEGNQEDASMHAFTVFRPEGDVSLVYRSISFFENEIFLYPSLKKIRIPADARFAGIIQGQLIFRLRSKWETGTRKFREGAVLSVPLEDATKDGFKPELVFQPGERESIEDVAYSRNFIFINVIENVRGRVMQFERRGKSWARTVVELPTGGSLSFDSSDSESDLLMVSFQDFLTPISLLMSENARPGARFEVIKTRPHTFKEDVYQAEQFEAVSRDGTKVPYSIVHAKDMKRDGTNPTILYGYGGFELMERPVYFGLAGPSWLERGGVYVDANIRGGGEFGPKWHQAAVGANRQKAFDDFIAVAEDLIRRKITSPRHLGIWGGSNGGLLVGAVFVQRPELFNAVVCEVPLLDMTRYHLLLSGHSWAAEYGTVDDPQAAPALLSYSPYQNVRAGVKYPRVFFTTSTKDDRVHPGHARKMVARMMELGHPVLYYENIEGGHSAAANLEQRAEQVAMKYVYMMRELFEPGS